MPLPLGCRGKASVAAHAGAVCEGVGEPAWTEGDAARRAARAARGPPSERTSVRSREGEVARSAQAGAMSGGGDVVGWQRKYAARLVVWARARLGMGVSKVGNV